MKSQWQGQLIPGPDSCGGKLILSPFGRSSTMTVFGLTREMLWVEAAYLHNSMPLYGFDLAGAQPAGPPLVPQAQPAIFPSTPHIHLCSNAPGFVQCADAGDVCKYSVLAQRWQWKASQLQY